ncbi:MAG: hypothetical protein KC468_03435, partial [Myxococcales bacterium]|nr:hypothetical protein [Myxococcales bacterium]
MRGLRSFVLCAPLVCLAAPSCTTGGDETTDSSEASGPVSTSGVTITTTGGQGGSESTSPGSSGESTTQATGGASEDSSANSSSGGFKFDVGEETSGGSTTGPDDSMCPCAPNSDLIYVLSDDKQLWTYNPENNLFVLVGALGCPTPNTTFSMGVGRNGYAWVQDTALVGLSSMGDLYRMNVSNPSDCTDPGYTPGANGWNHFGMAFVSASDINPCDSLYGAHWDGGLSGFGEGPGVGKLGVFDEGALQVNTIGPNNYNGAELTGTGDGRLYAFGGVPDAKLIQFDKQTADEIESISFAGFPLTQAFAFAFWGGDFYFFTE